MKSFYKLVSRKYAVFWNVNQHAQFRILFTVQNLISICLMSFIVLCAQKTEKNPYPKHHRTLRSPTVPRIQISREAKIMNIC